MHITQLVLSAADLPALGEFYAGGLGLAVESSTVGSLTIRAGETRLTFEQTGPPGRYHFAFGLPASRFRAAKTWLAARTRLIADAAGAEEFEFRDWNARAVYFYDPAGNIAEFIARPFQPEAETEPFGPADLAGVCEFGLVTDDVRGTVGRLASALGLPVYDGEGSDAFTAVGADSGLFIVVRRGRPWYPDTGVPGVIQTLTVRLADGAVVHGTPAGIEIVPPDRDD